MRTSLTTRLLLIVVAVLVTACGAPQARELDDWEVAVGTRDGPWLPLAKLRVQTDVPAARELWYRAPLPADLPPDQSLAVEGARYKLEAYIGDAKIYNFGHIDDAQERGYLGEPFHIIDLPASAAGQHILLRVASKWGDAELIAPVAFARHEEHLTRRMIRDASDLVIGSCLLLTAAVALMLYFFAGREPIGGLFALSAAGLGVYSICHTSLLSVVAPFPLQWDHLQYLVTYSTPAAFIGFTERVIGGFRVRALGRYSWFFPALALTVVAGSVARVFELPESLLLFQLVLAVAAAVLTYEVVAKAAKGDTAFRLFAWGVVLVCGGVVHDVAVDRGLLPWTIGLGNWAMLAMIGVHGVALAVRAKADSERKIEMRHELETAGILQTRILPGKVLEDEQFSLHAYNRTASEVGGDWYTYRVINGRWLQVHIGDVTGHGTRAALLASFAKGAVDFYYEDCRERQVEKPELDLLHTRLNQALCEMGKSEATMTMASLSVDLHTGEFEYVNSGHPSPVIYGSDLRRPTVLRARNPLLLGFEREQGSLKPSKGRIEGHELIILYSDGIQEVALVDEDPRTPNRATMDFLMLHATESARFACEMTALFSNMTATAKTIDDDVTLVAIKLDLLRKAVAA